MCVFLGGLYIYVHFVLLSHLRETLDSYTPFFSITQDNILSKTIPIFWFMVLQE